MRRIGGTIAVLVIVNIAVWVLLMSGNVANGMPTILTIAAPPLVAQIMAARNGYPAFPDVSKKYQQVAFAGLNAATQFGSWILYLTLIYRISRIDRAFDIGIFTFTLFIIDILLFLVLVFAAYAYSTFVKKDA